MTFSSPPQSSGVFNVKIFADADKPLERAIHDIENTAKEEFQKEIDIWNFYNKERREQVIPICYVALFMSIFIYSLCNLGNEEFVAIQWITGIIYILIYKVLQDF